MSARALTSSPPRRHLVLDPARVLLELERVRRELDDPLLPVEGVLAPDVHVPALDLDEVGTGAPLSAQAKRRDGSHVRDEDVLAPPRVRAVLVAREDEVHACALERLERVARVVDDVWIAPGTRHGPQVVVEDED